MLQPPKGISTIATVTEFQSKTSDIVAEAEQSGHGVLVVKNNDPYAVVLSFRRYTEMLNNVA